MSIERQFYFLDVYQYWYKSQRLKDIFVVVYSLRRGLEAELAASFPDDGLVHTFYHNRYSLCATRETYDFKSPDT